MRKGAGSFVRGSAATVLPVLFLAVPITFLNGCASTPSVELGARKQSPSSSAGDFRPQVSTTNCVLCAETNPLFVVDKDGNASGTLRLRNRGKDAVTLQLTISDFSAAVDDGLTDPLNAVSTLSAVDTAATPILEGTAQLQPGRWIEVKISAANLWQAGLSSASLMNGTEKLIDLKALRYHVPFNVKVEGATSERADVSLARSCESPLTLRNDDPMTYRFRWKVEIDGRTIEDVHVVQPYKSVSLPIRLPPESFPWLATGTLRRDVRAGVLTLEYEPDPGLRNYPLPVKRYPITARLSYWGDTPQRLWNSAWILILLLLGIGASLLINFALPLQKKRVVIKQRLADMEGRLAGLDEVIDPIDGRLLNQMRVEKKRLREELSVLQPIFPQSADDLPRLEDRITALSRRIDWVSKVGELLQRQERQSGDFSMAEIEQVRMRCREILEIAGKTSPSPEELQAAGKQLQDATGAVNRPDGPLPRELFQPLQQLADTLRAQILNFSNQAQWPPFEERLQSLLGQFPPQSQPGGPYQPTRRDFIRHEEAVRKASLVIDFIRLVEQSVGDDIRDKRHAQHERLLKALDPGPDASFQEACEIVEQTQQNVYLEDVLEEIKRGALLIDLDPPRPLPYQLTDFRVRFTRAGVDRAAALKEIRYEWSVNGEKLPGQDWSVTWFFQDKWRWLKMISRTLKMWRRGASTHFQIQVNLKKPGVESPLHQLFKNDVELERTRSSVEAKTWLSLGTLGVTILVVVLGLASGAEEKLSSLELLPGAIAVFLLGFGADTLKTLISRIQ